MFNRHPHDDHDKPLPEVLADLAARERLARRAALRRLGGAGMLLSPLGWAAVGCGEAVEGESLLASGASASGCSLIPSETGGPYPGDGTNGQNVLNASGIVRSDIRASFGALGSTAAAGTPLTVTLQLVNTNANCASLAGFAIYLWHCTAGGLYSLYSAGATNQNYLRGVQLTNAAGQVSFTTIFPGCYSGRWPHIHFEIYRNTVAANFGTSAAATGASALRTSQLALPKSACDAVYAQSALYPSSASNLSQVSLTSDNVFGPDGAPNQIATMSGSVAAGYVATLRVGVAA